MVVPPLNRLLVVVVAAAKGINRITAEVVVSDILFKSSMMNRGVIEGVMTVVDVLVLRTKLQEVPMPLHRRNHHHHCNRNHYNLNHSSLLKRDVLLVQ